MYIKVGNFVFRRDYIVAVERVEDEQGIIVNLVDGKYYVVEDRDGSVWNFLCMCLVDKDIYDYRAECLFDM